MSGSLQRISMIDSFFLLVSLILLVKKNPGKLSYREEW